MTMHGLLEGKIRKKRKGKEWEEMIWHDMEGMVWERT
jgi:uncharacterized protein YgfB (UPF0149 family)